MAISRAFLDMILEMLAPLGAVSARRMFGGASLYCDGILFALADDDVLYFKADEVTKERYEREGLGPFTYEGQTGSVAMSYWRAPERLYDDPDEMIDFAREAIAVAVRAKVTTTSGRAKSPKSDATPRGAQPDFSSQPKSKTRSKAPRGRKRS